MSKVIIDAKNCILGRLATFAAKRTLMNDEVVIVNCEHAVISGNRNLTLAKYRQKCNRGSPTQGPFIPKTADRMVKRTIRGMIPYKKGRGKEPFNRIRCYRGIPEDFAKGPFHTIKGASISKLPRLEYITVGEICNHLKEKK
ncbi:MAG: 50S ribosomal protein L13 [archaeon]